MVLPTVIAPLIAGAVWRLLLDNRYGPVNQIIGWLWGQPATLLWTVNPYLVYPAIFLAEIWQWTPFMFLVLLAALVECRQVIDRSGGNRRCGVLAHIPKITLPAIWPVMAIAILIRSLDLVRIFDSIWALTEGGPGHDDGNDLALYIRRRASGSSRRATPAQSHF